MTASDQIQHVRAWAKAQHHQYDIGIACSFALAAIIWPYFVIMGRHG